MLKIDLSGKVAVITGGTGQLGRAMVRTLADCGADIAINYLRADKMAQTLKHEVEARGRKCCVVKADVTSKEAVEAMRDQVKQELGPADIIVNNAVIQYKWVKVLEQSEEDYRSQFESCVLHNVLMAKAFVPDMMKKKWGRVIGINTECAMQCFQRQSAYVSGKRGMDGVLRILAKEVGEFGITVNQVAPGWMISENKPSELAPESYVNAVPLKRRGFDRDIANAVAFLASDLACFINGVYLPVCGGNVMPCI